MERYQISLPGPTECDPEVLNVLNCPNLPHYGALWIDFYWEIIGKRKERPYSKQWYFWRTYCNYCIAIS